MITLDRGSVATWDRLGFQSSVARNRIFGENHRVEIKNEE